GGGNMATAIIGGLLAKSYPAQNILVSEPLAESRTRLETQFGVLTSPTNVDAVRFTPHPSHDGRPADLVVFAVKPQILREVAEGIAAEVDSARPLIVTIAAGIRLVDLARWLSPSPTSAAPAIVRAMPNTPALVGEGATGLFAGAGVSEDARALAYSVIGAVSKSTYWVEREELIDVVTGLSGSGPAYFFLMVEALAAAAHELGLPLEVARGLAAQTCLGAGKMLTTSEDDAAELRRKVTSPKGTTEAAINSFEASGLRDACKAAVIAATKRGEELGDVFGKVGTRFFLAGLGAFG
ncbi:pyrroline-5-carboxylate reductase dimerization-domain-containing protein, partial [Blyttiomyces helicus]